MAPWVIPFIMAVAGGASSTASAISSSRANKSQTAMSREQIEAEKLMQARELALKESEMNPFRHQLSQAGSISSLDMMERGAYKPVSVQGAAPYAQYKPQVSGGFSYEKSPELIASAGALKRDVMAGNRAPSVLPAAPAPGTTGQAVPRGTATATGTPNGMDASAVMDLLALIYGNQNPMAPAGPAPTAPMNPRRPTRNRSASFAT